MEINKMLRTAKTAIPFLFGVTILLCAILIFLINRTTVIREEGAELLMHCTDMVHHNDEIVMHMMMYTSTLDPEILKKYNEMIDDYDFIYGRLDAMEARLTSSEKLYITRIKHLLSELESIEDAALDKIEQGDHDAAYELIFGGKYFEAVEELADVSHDLAYEIRYRTSKDARSAANQGSVGFAVLVIFFIATLVMLRFFINWFAKKMQEFANDAHWYQSLLNALPLPFSVTDMDLKSTYINKATEDMLGITMAEVKGMHCADIWKAGICNTKDCGVACLKRGQSSTQFSHGDFEFKVDASYLYDLNNKPVGHIEVVQNITDIVKAQKEQEKLLDAIHQASQLFLSDAKVIADGATSLADSATGQSAIVEELSASVNDIKDKTIRNSEIAKEATSMSTSIIANAQKGSEEMDKMMQAVREIDESSKQIEKVIKVIDSIASQTNLLSLNAAIEAARAGEAGRGFAVVAEEVRDLATKSAEAAKDTGKLIFNTVEKAQLGLKMATETAGSLNEIVEGINRNATLIDGIAKSCELQVDAIGHLNLGIDEVAQIAEETSATAEESASTSMEMSDQAQRLEDLISGR
ncbi:MAG: methyl-accepting chemotaxis protein [Lachnospiraceae bacterium]|nr:methyl-accepting chemotaxis protein [Lachnospiraceae bacterium]